MSIINDGHSKRNIGPWLCGPLKKIPFYQLLIFEKSMCSSSFLTNVKRPQKIQEESKGPWAFYISTGCLVMNVKTVFSYCKGQKFVSRPITFGKSLLYIGYIDILWAHWIQVIFRTAFSCSFNLDNNWDISKYSHTKL